MRKLRDAHWITLQPLSDVMRCRLPLQRGVHGQHNLVNPAHSDPFYELADGEVFGTDTVQR